MISAQIGEQWFIVSCFKNRSKSLVENINIDSTWINDGAGTEELRTSELTWAKGGPDNRKSG